MLHFEISPVGFRYIPKPWSTSGRKGRINQKINMTNNKLFKDRNDLVKRNAKTAAIIKLANAFLVIGLRIAQLAILLKQIFSAKCHWTRRRFLTKMVAVCVL